MLKKSANAWTEKELSILKTYYSLGDAVILEKLQTRNITAIHKRAQSMGLSAKKSSYNTRWADDEYKILDNNKNATLNELIPLLPRRTSYAIYAMQRQRANKQVKPRIRKQIINNYIFTWDALKNMEQYYFIEAIKKEYRKKTGLKLKHSEIARMLGISLTLVEGWRVAPEFKTFRKMATAFKRCLYLEIKYGLEDKC